jgi:hypothetical protein
MSEAYKPVSAGGKVVLGNRLRLKALKVVCFAQKRKEKRREETRMSLNRSVNLEEENAFLELLEHSDEIQQNIFAYGIQWYV